MNILISMNVMKCETKNVGDITVCHLFYLFLGQINLIQSDLITKDTISTLQLTQLCWDAGINHCCIRILLMNIEIALSCKRFIYAH